MIRKAFLFLFLCFAAFPLQGAPKQVQAFFSFGIYSTLAGMPYAEVYLKIPAATLHFSKNADKKFVAGANVQLYILRKDTVVFKNDYSLKTMPLEDSVSNAILLDIRRFELPNGLYDLLLFIQDENDTLNEARINIPLQVSVAPERIQIADILFCDTLYPVMQPDMFTRYGYNFIPSVSNMMEQNRNSLLFYNEIYNTLAVNGNGDFRYMISVRNMEGNLVPGYEKIRSKKNAKLNYLFDVVDISRLPGGEYYLQVAVLDKKNKPVAKRDKYFIRLTDSLINFLNAQNKSIRGISAQEIKDFLEYLEPVATREDLDYLAIAKRKDSAALQEWFYDFWEERDPENPQKAYTDYVKAITIVQAQFGTILSKGYRTDRGRIYLKYGKPDNVTPYTDEPNAYPYEIWHYYKTTTRNNVKFIFYNPTQIHNDYILLHSEMPGEKQNPNWKRMIYRRIDKSKSIDDNNSPRNFGDDLDKNMKE